MRERNEQALIFSVGRRYNNRTGEYEVLEIHGDRMRVRYDDGREQQLSVESQTRIIQNMAREAIFASPYPPNQEHRNNSFFFTLGFLAVRATILEAFVPPQSLVGFNQDYARLKGSPPRRGHTGLVIHPPGTDKWGSELRITFEASSSELERLDFGPNVNLVDDPMNVGVTYRINNNGFWWRLLAFGFELGNVQDVNNIRTHIPARFREQFDEGYNHAN